MKIIYLLIAFGVAATSVNAQTDQKAKDLVDAVSNKLKTFKGVTANFKLFAKSSAGKVLNNTSGRLLAKGNKYYIKQGANEIFSDGNKVWNYNGNDEVTVTNVADDAQGTSPQAILTGFNNTNYNAKIVSSTAVYNQIQLTPIDKRKNFKRVDIFVDKAKNMITRAKIVDKSNSTIDFTLSNINVNASIPDNTFVFDKNKYQKKIEVIE